MNKIQIRGARTHNLKNIDLDIPRDKLIVVTGISGSGKSSLAFDTIYADGQRRYVESLSAYARQFLSMMEKPDVDYIEGLSPAISIEQKTTSHNPRSTVGTITEIYDYLRLLYARVGDPHCPKHNICLKAQTISQMVDIILSYPEGERFILLAPIVQDRKGEHMQIFERLRSEGFIRVRINKKIYELEELPKLDANKKNNIEVVVDRFKIHKDMRLRLAESCETAVRLSAGIVMLASIDSEQEIIFSSRFACAKCGYSIAELHPRLFSFNNIAGACSVCDGLGMVKFFDPKKIIRAPEFSLASGAIKGWDRRNLYYYQMLKSLSDYYKFDIDTPFKRLNKKVKNIILYGSGDENIPFEYARNHNKVVIKKHAFEGIIPNFERRYYQADAIKVREDMAKYQSSHACEECSGSRLNEAARHVLVAQNNIASITCMPIVEAKKFIQSLKLDKVKKQIADKIVKEINVRLEFLVNVGLDYLTLDRGADSLSGGEAQRIRLASQIGGGLVGVMYVLDEPSIGLHHRDNKRLLNTLFHLRDMGNTVIVVEHDEEAILAADYVIDIGPGAGVHGGYIVAKGTPKQIVRSKSSVTGQYLSGKKTIDIPDQRVEYNKKRVLKLFKANGNNLRKVNLTIPIGLITCITGVSGSGKSTLINDTLYQASAQKLNHANANPAMYDRITGLHHFNKAISIDQSPIGRTPRSNPATYTGLFSLLRELFAATPEARSRGYKIGRFSFNVKGGRCEACQGDGLIKVEMHFLPDTYVLCDVCVGQRYNRETLDVCYKGKNIYEVLEMSVEEAYDLFYAVPTVRRKLQTLMDVGLSYIKLGQNSVMLSGGEAQRVKLSKELSKTDIGKTLYVLDEPTTGLHFSDIKQLLAILYRLRDRGNTIVIIEHNLDVIKISDWIVDLGPEGGNGGGRIIANGTPEEVSQVKQSHTGQCLATVFSKRNS